MDYIEIFRYNHKQKRLFSRKIKLPENFQWKSPTSNFNNVDEIFFCKSGIAFVSLHKLSSVYQYVLNLELSYYIR